MCDDDDDHGWLCGSMTIGNENDESKLVVVQ